MENVFGDRRGIGETEDQLVMVCLCGTCRDVQIADGNTIEEERERERVEDDEMLFVFSSMEPSQRRSVGLVRFCKN